MSSYRNDTTKDHPLFGADPWDYFAGQKWRARVEKTTGPKGFWFRVHFTNGAIEWIWVDE